MFKWKDILSKLESWVGQKKDFDGYYGSQCVDLIMFYVHDLTGFKTWGNAIDYKDNKLPEGWARFHTNLNPIPGDIVVFHFGPYDRYGHVGIVKEFNGGILTLFEANTIGDLTVGGPVKETNFRTMQNVVAIIRPNNIEFDKEERAAQKTEYRLVPEKWRFTVMVDVLNVRSKPSTTEGEIVAQYKKGEVINYDGYIITNGYVWISYVSTSGHRRYVAARVFSNGRIVESYGHFR